MEQVLSFPEQKKFTAIHRDASGYLVQHGKKARRFLTFREALCYCYGRGWLWKHRQIAVIADDYRERLGIV